MHNDHISEIEEKGMTKLIYPGRPQKTHKNVIAMLLNGEFIGIEKAEYEHLQKYQEWYSDFLLETFEIELRFSRECYFCVSPHRGTGYTKKILTVVAIMMYEIDKSGRDAVDTIRHDEFSMDSINKLILNSVQFGRYAVKVEPRFINKLVEFGLIKMTSGNKFVFSSGIDVFMDEFDDLRREVPGLSK